MSCKFLLALNNKISRQKNQARRSGFRALLTHIVIGGIACGLNLSAIALEGVVVDYQYAGNHGIDFSELRAAPLAIAEFEDQRGEANPKSIPAIDGGKQYQLQKPLSALVKNAFEQAFESGGAPLDDAAAQLKLDGKIQELSLVALDDAQLQITLKTKVRLEKVGSNKTLWQSTLFGRATASQKEGMQVALSRALDKLIEALMYDDYFLMEVLP